MSYEPLTERAALHCISFKARPLPGHPRYYAFQVGLLSVWLFANSVEDATERASLIVGALPYERIGDAARFETDFPQTEESRAMNGRAQEEAEQIGLAIRVWTLETGADETAFESMPLGPS